MSQPLPMTQTKRILVVDDDSATVALHRTMLAELGHDVTTATRTLEALRLLFRTYYDVLITDMHIESANDGFLLASVCKRLHPSSRVVLVTGNPDFTSSIHDFQMNVDEVLLKSEPVTSLQDLVASYPMPRKQAHTPGRSRIASVMRDKREQLIIEWCNTVECDERISRITVPREERIDHIGDLLDALVFRLENSEHSGKPSEVAAAEVHGALRRKQGYTPQVLVNELGYVRRVLHHVINDNLLILDLSTFWQDLQILEEGLDAEAYNSLRGFTESERVPVT